MFVTYIFFAICLAQCQSHPAFIQHMPFGVTDEIVSNFRPFTNPLDLFSSPFFDSIFSPRMHHPNHKHFIIMMRPDMHSHHSSPMHFELNGKKPECELIADVSEETCIEPNVKKQLTADASIISEIGTNQDNIGESGNSELPSEQDEETATTMKDEDTVEPTDISTPNSSETEDTTQPQQQQPTAEHDSAISTSSPTASVSLKLTTNNLGDSHDSRPANENNAAEQRTQQQQVNSPLDSLHAVQLEPPQDQNEANKPTLANGLDHIDQEAVQTLLDKIHCLEKSMGHVKVELEKKVRQPENPKTFDPVENQIENYKVMGGRGTASVNDQRKAPVAIEMEKNKLSGSKDFSATDRTASSEKPLGLALLDSANTQENMIAKDDVSL